MATHSSILAWRIPRREAPSGLQSMGLQSRTRLKRLGMHALFAGTLSFLLHLLAVNSTIHGSASPPWLPEPWGPRASIYARHRLHVWLLGNLPFSPAAIPALQSHLEKSRPFQGNLFSLHCLDIQAVDRLTSRWHVGQPCGKASWESLV